MNAWIGYWRISFATLQIVLMLCVKVEQCLASSVGEQIFWAEAKFLSIISWYFVIAKLVSLKFMSEISYEYHAELMIFNYVR